MSKKRQTPPRHKLTALLPAFSKKKTALLPQLAVQQTQVEMSFEAVSDQLRTLQGANTQLKALIDRLANTNFQPGSVPLNSQDGNVVTELTTDSNDRIREQDEQLELLLEEVHDLDAGRENSELAQQKDQLLSNVTRAIKDLKS